MSISFFINNIGTQKKKNPTDTQKGKPWPKAREKQFLYRNTKYICVHMFIMYIHNSFKKQIRQMKNFNRELGTTKKKHWNPIMEK